MEQALKQPKKKASLLQHKFISIIISNLLGWLVYLVSSIIDQIVAGNYLDVDGLAAVEIVLPILSLMTFFTYLFGNGAGILYSHYIGDGNKQRAKEIFGLGLVASSFWGILMFVALLLFGKQFIALFNPSENVFNLAVEYLTWYIPLCLVFPPSIYIYRLVCEDGDVVYTVASDIVQMVANVVLSFLLIEQFGIVALSFSTFASYTISGIVTCGHFFKKNNSLRLGFKFSWKDLGQMLKLGAGVSIFTLFTAILDIIINAIIIAEFGDNYLACYAIVNFSISVTALITGISSAITPLISAGDGAKNLSDIKDTVKLGLKWIIIISIICTIVFVGGAYFIPAIFNVPEGELYLLSVVTAASIGAVFVIYGLLSIIDDYYTCLGKVVASVIDQSNINLIMPLVLVMPLIYLFKGLGYNGYYGLILAFMVTPIITLLISVIRLLIVNKDRKIISYPDYGETQFSVDAYLNDENIVFTTQKIEEKMRNLDIENSTIVKTISVVEDMMGIIYYSNSNKKVIERITISIGDKKVRVFSKDNGKIFNLTDTFKDKENASRFLIFGKVRRSLGAKNTITFSFNSITLNINRDL